MTREKEGELRVIKVKCHKCGCENIVALKRIIDLLDPIRCSSCGEKIVIIGETTVVFED